MRIFIRINLSQAGRRADVIAGGSGSTVHDIEVIRDSISPAEFRTIMEAADIDGNDAILDLREGLTAGCITVPIPAFDWVPNIAEASVVFRDAVRELAIRRAEEDLRRSRLGLRDGDYDFLMERDLLLRVPIHEKTSGARNWMATVRQTPTAPGGLDRAWMRRTREQNDEDGYYQIRPMQVGEVIEFGADLMGVGGRRFKKRWYGYFVRRTPNMIVLHQTPTASTAFQQGAIYAASVAPPPPPPPARDKPRRRRIGGFVEETRPPWEL